MNCYFFEGYDVVIDPNNPNIIYAGGAIDKNNRQLLVMTVKKSIDGGKSWTEFQLSQTHGAVQSLALDPSNSKIIYAGGYDSGGKAKIFKSNDAGLHWENVSSGLNSECKSVNDIQFLPQASDTLFAGCNDGFYCSTNAGVQWTRLSDQVREVSSIVIEGDSISIFYAASKKHGFFISYDRGENWIPKNEGLTDNQIYMLAFDPTNHLLFAGTNCSGVWRFDPNMVPPKQSVVPDRFHLKQNYPNPFNQATTIGYEIPENEPVPVTLKIYNLKGQLIKSLISAIMETGSYSAKWDGRDENGSLVGTGIYFCLFQAGKYTDIIKMTFIK